MVEENKSPFEQQPVGSYMDAMLAAEFEMYKSKAQSRLDAMAKWNNAYMGRYDFAIPEDQSDVYPQMTRVFVAAAMAKLIEIMLPSNGDSPWDIRPTPIPKTSAPIVVMGPEGPVQITPEQVYQLAKDASERMRDRIKDNLVEMEYETQLVSALLELVVFGTMVFLGPYRKDKPSSRWKAILSHGSVEMKKVGDDDDIRPHYAHIPLHNFFPDPFVNDIREAYAAWTQEIVGKQTIHKMIASNQFDNDAIYEYLATHPKGDWDGTGTEADLMAAAGQDNLMGQEGKFVVKERYGFIDAETLIREGLLPEDASPHATYMSHLIMLGDKRIYFEMKGLDHYAHPPFIITPYEKKIGSMFGRGVPEQMADPQSVTGSLVRAMVDNLAYSVAPLTEIDADLVDQNQTPNKLTPRMVVVRKQRFQDTPNSNPAVRFTNVPALLENIMPSLGYFKELCQLQTSLPFATMNLTDQASGIRTIGQQNAYFKAMEGFIRLVVTNLDQMHTIPMLVTQYDWEMTFNPDQSIKGDFKVEARGVRGALAREVITQRRIEIMQISSSSPALAERMKPNVFVKLTNRDLGLDHEDLFYSDEEWAQIQEQAAAQKASEIAAQAEARRFKAETPVKDLLVQLATSNKDPNSKAWPAQQAVAYKSLGEKDPQLYALLSSMADDAAKTASPEQAGIVQGQDFQPPAEGKSAKPDSPGEQQEVGYGDGVADLDLGGGEQGEMAEGYGEGVADLELPAMEEAAPPKPRKKNINFKYDENGRMAGVEVE